MITQSIDPSFGHWLAGFTDGEGAFILSGISEPLAQVGRTKIWYSPRYEITLRADDLALLEAIRDTLGFGAIYKHIATSAKRPNQMPSSRLSIHRVETCLQIVDLFTAYPLRGKKQHQFNAWAAAVREIAKGRLRDNVFVAARKAELTALRYYSVPVHGVNQA